MNEPSFRPASAQDVPFLVELRKATMAAHEEASGVFRSPEQSLERVLVSFDAAQIIMFDGRPAGLLKVLRNDLEWELLQLQLAPDRQGAGIGSRIVRALLTEARGAGAVVRLGVLKANPARRVYERLGFVVVGEQGHSFEMAANSGVHVG